MGGGHIFEGGVLAGHYGIGKKCANMRSQNSCLGIYSLMHSWTEESLYHKRLRDLPVSGFVSVSVD